MPVLEDKFNNPILIIAASTISKRLEYVVDFIFGSVLKWPFQLCLINEVNEFSSDNIIFYGQSSDKYFSLSQDGFLDETSIEPKQLELEEVMDLKAIFYDRTSACDLPVDVFSLVFYFISRYEEYHSVEKDKFGRFPSNNAFLVKHRIENFPLVDQWILKLANLLKLKYGNLPEVNVRWTLQPSFDVDQAWKYQHKGFFRNFGGFLKDMVRMDYQALSQRVKVLSGLVADPYFTFNEIELFHKNPKPLFFILLGKYGGNDINISKNNKVFRSVLHALARKFSLGIHPSIGAFDDVDLMKNELDSLSAITGKAIFKSRQHFILMSMPQTYRQLIAIGINEDYSMGFADRTGYRAGTGHPFYWFDLEKNQTTALKVYPFVFMDVTARHYLKFDSTQMLKNLEDFAVQYQKTGGTMVTIWHNSSFIDDEGWIDYLQVYKRFYSFYENPANLL